MTSENVQFRYVFFFKIKWYSPSRRSQIVNIQYYDLLYELHPIFYFYRWKTIKYHYFVKQLWGWMILIKEFKI